jgi:hypothetical protein
MQSVECGHMGLAEIFDVPTIFGYPDSLYELQHESQALAGMVDGKQIGFEHDEERAWPDDARGPESGSPD